MFYTLIALALLGCADSDSSPVPNKHVATEQDTTEEVPSAPTDNDGDRSPVEIDCDDSDPNISPDADELCDGVDNDCDGVIDPATSLDAWDWHRDQDGDRHGNPEVTVYSCHGLDGYDADDDDCDDTDPNVGPDMVEVCDGIDNDCQNGADDNHALDARPWYNDADLDGSGDGMGSPLIACSQPSGMVDNGNDCDDMSADSFPGAEEVCDWMDNDCDWSVDEEAADSMTLFADMDSDTFGDPNVTFESCEFMDGFTLDNTDCDDTDPNMNMGIDDDADGVPTCDDCDDSDETVSPRAVEGCVDRDLDCNGVNGLDESECLVPITCTDNGLYLQIAWTIPAGYSAAWDVDGFTPIEVTTVALDHGTSPTSEYLGDGTVFTADLAYSAWAAIATNEAGDTAWSEMTRWYIDESTSTPGLCAMAPDLSHAGEFYVEVP